MKIRSLLLAVVLLVPLVAGAQTDAFCTAVYDANGTRVAFTVIPPSTRRSPMAGTPFTAERPVG